MLRQCATEEFLHYRQQQWLSNNEIRMDFLHIINDLAGPNPRTLTSYIFLFVQDVDTKSIKNKRIWAIDSLALKDATEALLISEQKKKKSLQRI